MVDEVEQLAIDRLKQLFGAEHANVQPHSGAQANFAAFMARDQAGRACSWACRCRTAGHLSHGAAVNHSGVVWRAVHYGVDPATGRIDYDVVREQARRERPKLIIAGGSAYARIIDFAAFRSIADEVGALFLVDMAHFAGLVAGGVYPSPVPHAQVVTSTTHKTLRGPAGRSDPVAPPSTPRRSTSRCSPAPRAGRSSTSSPPRRSRSARRSPTTSRPTPARSWTTPRRWPRALIERGFAIVSGGTDTHLMLVDLRPKGLTGKVAEKMLGQAGITVNKNTIPDDPQSPFVTSGIRLGTPGAHHARDGHGGDGRVAELIDRALTHPDEATLARVKAEVEELTSAFPLYAPAQARAESGGTRQSSAAVSAGERTAVCR